MTRRHRIVSPDTDPRALLIGLAVIAFAVIVLFVAMRSAGGLPGETHYDLRVQFARSSAASVLPARGSDVRIAGRRVGQTRDATVERGVTTLHLQLDGDAPRVPVDTRAEIRGQGLLGARYVDLVPGRSSRTLPDESFIASDRSAVRITLSDALQAFDARARPGLGRVFRGLGGGLAGRAGRLNEGLDDLARRLDGFQRVFEPILADGTLGPLVRDAEAFATALSPVGDDLARLLVEGERAVRPFATERESVARLLDTAPGSLDGIRGALRASDPLLVRTTAFARTATEFSDAAPRGLDSLTRVLRDGRAPLAAADDVLRTAGAAVDPTLRLTRALRPTLPRLDAILRVSRQPARTLGEYGCDIARFGRTWRSMIGYAARGQSGPLGPLAILRTTLVASGGLAGLPNPTPGAKADGTIEPCEPLRGPR